jgi:hypothetical protein
MLAREMAQAGFAGVRMEKLDLRPMPAVCVLGQAASTDRATAHERATTVAL